MPRKSIFPAGCARAAARQQNTVYSNMSMFSCFFHKVNHTRIDKNVLYVIIILQRNGRRFTVFLKEESFMKSTGIVRRVDELGRIVLPIELRRTLDITERDSLEIYVDGASIVLKKYQPACIFCDSSKDVILYKGKNICANCLKDLKEQV